MVIGNPAKHHYVPVFYLRWWAGQDGRLERYTRPRPDKIMAKRVFPTEAGFERNLYSSPDDKQLGSTWLETRIFQRIDAMAAPVMEKLNAAPVPQLSDEERSAWSIFIRALFYRTPATLKAVKSSAAHDWREVVKCIGDRYNSIKGLEDPPTLEAYIAQHSELDVERMVLRVIPSIFVSERVGQVLNDLYMRVIVTPPDALAFLISDDFVVRTNGVLVAGGHFAIPISPHRLVVMAYEASTLRAITALPPQKLVTQVNRWVAESARYFVGAVDRTQERFIRNRFGTQLKEPVSRRQYGKSGTE